MTGCTGNSKGLSNSVSDVLEAVANGERDPYEVCSGEDMLSRVHAENLGKERGMDGKKSKENFDRLL